MIKHLEFFIIKTMNYLKPDATDHEGWFERNYLKPLGLCNKNIRTDDFEGIICKSEGGQELAIFELKLVTLNNIQKDVSKEFASANYSGGLILYPKQEEIRSRLRDIISEARNQVLEKEKSLVLPRIIFLITNNPDIRVNIGVSIISAIKGKRVTIFPDGINTFESAISQNEEVTDLFYNDNLSGAICIYTGMVEHRGVSVIKNIKAKNQIPREFLSNANIQEI